MDSSDLDKEFQSKLDQLYESLILGSYNPNARFEAIKLKFEQEVKKYKNKDKLEKIRIEESKIKDSNKLRLFQITNNVDTLDSDVDEFNESHYNLKFRQLKEQCVKYQVELDSVRFPTETTKYEELRQEKRELYRRIEVIEQKLMDKVTANIRHTPESCPDCN